VCIPKAFTITRPLLCYNSQQIKKDMKDISLNEIILVTKTLDEYDQIKFYTCMKMLWNALKCTTKSKLLIDEWRLVLPRKK
jgi:hypothetical protein